MVANKYKTVLILSVCALFMCVNGYANGETTNWVSKIGNSADDSTRLEGQNRSISNNINSKLDNPIFKKGFYNYSTIGFLTGNSEEMDNFTFSFHSTCGYEFSPHLGAGLGVGVEKLETEIIPLTVGIKSNILKSKLSPIVHFHTGYSLPLSKKKYGYDNREINYKGGFRCGIDIGISNFRSGNYAFSITAGYLYQRLKSTAESPNYWRRRPWSEKEFTTYEFHKIAIRLGFFFREAQKYDKTMQ